MQELSSPSHTEHDLSSEQIWRMQVNSHPMVSRLAYTYDANMIFHPEKLLDVLIEKAGDDCSQLLTLETIAENIMAGYVSFDVAVKRYYFVPENYSVVGNYIYHVPLRCRIPKAFNSMADIYDALVDIMTGKPVTDVKSGFIWDNQPLEYMGPQSLSSGPLSVLPSAHLVDDYRNEHPTETPVYVSQLRTGFYPGLPWIDMHTYTRIDSASSKWENFRAHMEQVACDNAGRIMEKVRPLNRSCFHVKKPLGRINEELFPVVHIIYPELDFIHPEVLYYAYIRFQADFHGLFNESSITRDTNFLFYMLGYAGMRFNGHGRVNHLDGFSPAMLIEFGHYAAYFLHKGLPFQNAFSNAADMYSYKIQINNLCEGINNAMRFMAKYQPQGPTKISVDVL